MNRLLRTTASRISHTSLIKSTKNLAPKRTSISLLLSVALAATLVACGGGGNVGPTEGATIDMAILETNDLHTNILSYDYYKGLPDLTLGLERTATLINNARQEFKNNLLVDDGDTIQGTSLADYQALVSRVDCADTLAIYKAMDYLKYDVATVGNHEFNYGLDYLYQVTGKPHSFNGSTRTCKAPNTPFVLANVNDATTKQLIFAPYTILPKQFIDSTGNTVTLNVGVIGFAPTAIMQWDSRNLAGKVTADDVVATATKYVPEIRKAGADIVVALVHGGISTNPADQENPVYFVAGVAGIDAIVSGHSHSVFPNTTIKATDIDNAKGLIKGIPVANGGFWGSQLGVIKLSVTRTNGKWIVDGTKSSAEARKIYDSTAKKSLVDADANIASLFSNVQTKTLEYVNTPIGSTELRLSSYLSQVGDTASIDVLNAAQTDYVSSYIQANLPQYKNLPVISAQAPFKGGFAGATDYTDIAVGPLSIRSAADLYLYSNTVYAVKITGKSLKGWLENSALQFNQIDPTMTTDQQLLSSSFKVYNFDVFSGVNYQIDVTQPAGSRIVNLSYNGLLVADTQEFIVATNNYRASGITNPGIYRWVNPADVTVLLASPDANRDVVINYVQKTKTITTAKFKPTQNWRIAKLASQAGKIVFRSAPAANSAMATEGIDNVTLYNNTPDSKGLVAYSIDLTK